MRTDVESFPYGGYSGGLLSEELQIGHYTQVVWAETYEVGCGFMRKTSLKYQNKFEDVSM